MGELFTYSNAMVKSECTFMTVKQVYNLQNPIKLSDISFDHRGSVDKRPKKMNLFSVGRKPSV